MAKTDFTDRTRSPATARDWIEDFVVRTSDGEAVGTVAEVLDRGGERLLVVQGGPVPHARNRHVLPWREVEEVDHEALAVWLRLDQPAFSARVTAGRPSSRVAIATAGVAAFTFLIVVAITVATGSAWPMLLAAIPAVLAVAAIVSAYRADHDPDEPRGARTP